MDSASESVGEAWGDWRGKNDERYQEINDAIQNPEKHNDALDYVMTENHPIEDVIGIIENGKEIAQNMKANGASKTDIAAIEAAISQANASGTLDANNPK